MTLADIATLRTLLRQATNWRHTIYCVGVNNRCGPHEHVWQRRADGARVSVWAGRLDVTGPDGGQWSAPARDVATAAHVLELAGIRGGE